MTHNLYHSPRLVKDVVLRFGGLTTRRLEIGTIVHQGDPETPQDRSIAFFENEPSMRSVD